MPVCTRVSHPCPSVRCPFVCLFYRQESDLQWEALFVQSTVAQAVARLDGNFIDCNNAFSLLMGSVPITIAHTPSHRFVHCGLSTSLAAHKHAHTAVCEGWYLALVEGMVGGTHERMCTLGQVMHCSLVRVSWLHAPPPPLPHPPVSFLTIRSE